MSSSPSHSVLSRSLAAGMGSSATRTASIPSLSILSALAGSLLLGLLLLRPARS